MRKEGDVATTNLKTIRDQLRVKIHLAEMDARSTWRQLKPRLRDLERKSARAGAAAQVEIEAALKKLRSSLRSLRKHVESARR
jgi:hypothetical protein